MPTDDFQDDMDQNLVEEDITDEEAPLPEDDWSGENDEHFSSSDSNPNDVIDEYAPPAIDTSSPDNQSFDFDDDTEDEQSNGLEPSIKGESTQLASHPARSAAILFALLAATVFILYKVIFATGSETAEAPPTQQQPISEASDLPKDQGGGDSHLTNIEVPPLPDVEPLDNTAPPPLASADGDIQPPSILTSEPIAPPPVADAAPPPLEQSAAPPLPTDATPETPKIEDSATTDEQQLQATGPTEAEILAAKRARRRLSMLVVSGGGEPSENSTALGGEDRTLTLNEVRNSTAPTALVGKMSNLDYLIAQGKMIHAVLETAINTDLPGSLRAIISRDVYAESGRSVLIPKGSRLLGAYESNVKRGQKRVLITWDRVVMPNGLDIMIGSQGTDRLGRAGVRGLVDNKYYELFKNSILLSAITVGGSIAVESFNGKGSITNSTTTSGSDTTNSQTGTATDFAVLDSVKDLNDISSGIAEGLLDAKPTIVVDQGTLINVFVNKDLIFPADATTGGTKIVH